MRRLNEGASAEDLRQDVVGRGEIGEAGIARIGAGGAVGEVAIETLARPLSARGVDLAAVEASTLLGVAQQIVSR